MKIRKIHHNAHWVQINHCYAEGVETFFLNLPLLFAMILVLLSAGITGLIIKAYHCLRSKKQAVEHEHESR